MTTLAAAAKPAPLQHIRPVAAVAGLYVLAAVAWLAFGFVLPGGRWLAVHLFTLGILTNLIVALTHHFAQTLLHTPARGSTTPRFVVLNIGVLTMLASGPPHPVVFGLGATTVTAAIAWLYVDLRRMRKASLSSRFAFIVRAYERACGAFLHGALLGILIGVGVLGGTWYGAARFAHLHLNILGWGGLTLLATVVFFGPTMMRTRMREGADDRAAQGLRHGMTALTVAALLLLASGLGGAWGSALRALAGFVLVGFAFAATVVCRDVVLAGNSAKPSTAAWMIRAACAWFIVVVWADVLVVATGTWRLLDALGATLIVAVLGQAILASLAYFAPMLTAGGPDARTAARDRVELAARTRVWLLNAGVALVAVAAVLGRGFGDAGTLIARAGWALVALVAIVHVGLIVAAVLRSPLRTSG